MIDIPWCTSSSLIMVPHGQADVPFASHCVLPPQNCGWEPKFQKNFLWGGNWIFLSFYYVKGFLWAGKLGRKRENPDFFVGDPTPEDTVVKQTS